MEITSALVKMRKSRKLSQEKMAELMNMSRSNIAKLETGRVELKGIDLLRWCKVTNNPDMLMALYAAIDITYQIQPFLQPITGTILRLGGIA